MEVQETNVVGAAQSNVNSKKKSGIKLKLIAQEVLPALVVAVVVAVFARSNMVSGMEQVSLNGLESLAVATMAGYSNMAGDYHFENDTFYKGDTNLTAEMDELDNYVKDSDAAVTICWGKTRVMTTLLDSSGNRIIGTDVSDEVWTTVQRGETYTTTHITINDEDYAACYMPLRDPDGSIVGIVFAGQPRAGVDAYINQRVVYIAILTAVMLVVVAVIGFTIANALAKCLIKTNDALMHLASGELHTVVDPSILKRNDEIGAMGDALNGLIAKLRDVVGNLLQSANEVDKGGESMDSMAAQCSAATDEISRAVDEISRGAVSQAEEIENASGQIVEIGGQIESIVSSVGNLTNISNSMSEAGDDAMKTMHQLSDSSDKTVAALNSIAQQIQMTNEAVRKISEATELITSIASQTSLLSLNASIEAARAGEAGRGFAVVATEIQKLSVQSNDAAVEIQNIINTLQSEAQKTVDEMKNAEVLMQEQQSKLDDTKAKFNDVSNGIGVSRQGTEEIRIGADSADNSRTVVIDVISNLSAISEENAASAQETTASMQELNATINVMAQEATKLKEIAKGLNEDMAFFKM